MLLWVLKFQFLFRTIYNTELNRRIFAFVFQDDILFLKFVDVYRAVCRRENCRRFAKPSPMVEKKDNKFQ